MNSCEIKTIGWNTKKRRSSEVAELLAPSIHNTANLIYITLAKESPTRVLESDEDIYNSFNEQETGFKTSIYRSSIKTKQIP